MNSYYTCKGRQLSQSGGVGQYALWDKGRGRHKRKDLLSVKLARRLELVGKVERGVGRRPSQASVGVASFSTAA